VHDIGKLIVAMNLTRRFPRDRRRGAPVDPPESLHAVEIAAARMSHAELGAYLLGTWGPPATVVEAAAFHHCPSAVSEGPCEVLAAVHRRRADRHVVQRRARPRRPSSGST
jgi:HD-like signal output (HDOD) protein